MRTYTLALLLISVVALRAQEPAKVEEKVTKETKAVAKTEAKENKESKEVKESPRLQKFKQLYFDRRPSSILKAWSSPPAKEKDEKEKKKDPLDLELELVHRDVALGAWERVKGYFAKLPKDEGPVCYKHLLQSLAQGPSGAQAGPQVHPELQQFGEKNQFAADDIVALAAAAPAELDKDALERLGGVVQQALNAGHVVEHIAARFKAEVARPKSALTQRQAAKVLTAAGQAASTADFLPSLAKAKEAKDLEALNLLTRHYLALYARERKPAPLEHGWEANQAVLAVPGAPQNELEEALRRAVELATKVKEELGQAWLDQSFTKEPQRGMAILATIGTLGAQGLPTRPREPDERLKALQLQKTAVEALLKAAPARAKEWRDTLSLLAGVWLKEAEYTYQRDTSTSLGPRLQRDRFGNFYYFDMMERMQMNNPNQPQPIHIGPILEQRPGDAWLDKVDDGLRPKLAIMYAQLYLKVNEEVEAFPYIERIARTQPEQARELVKDFLRVWARNHNPNGDRPVYFNPFMAMYGMERQADGIALTRSRQERNLVELAEWVQKLRALKVGELEEELLAKAFTDSHSSAEVYRLEAIEKVFGPIKSIKPRTLAGLVQQMRSNLAGAWRQPGVQKDKKTNRKTKDIQAEVLRGYAIGRKVVDDTLKTFPDDWSLHLARGALMLDENNYQQELARTTDYSRRRREALEGFAHAAKMYTARLKDLREEEETIQVFEQWFHAGLGACDLNHIDENTQPDLRQPALIRAALKALPGEAAERHMSKFASALVTQLGSVKAAVKHRYLNAGFEIVGDHKLAREARKVYEYYKDLVTEIKFETLIDGPDQVGHGQPFGVFVNFRHTREIEREAGGFGRYLQNQQNMFLIYNFGRPNADYRDRFQTTVTEALKEHFEVLSVTFQSDKVNSRALPEYGWRYTPYAYLLLKARGPQVDKLPPLRMDLDFLDASGFVILPIESPTLAIDAKGAKGAARPVKRLQLTQILDERQADKGKLIVEVKASALGLVPELEQILDLHPEGFDVVKTDDQGVSVARFDPDAVQNAIVSERNWLVTLQAQQGREAPPAFHFGTEKVEGAEMVFQRYQDADLVSAGREVSLEQKYGKESYTGVWISLGVGALTLVLVIVVLFRLRHRAPPAETSWKLPHPLTPFTVLALLERVQQDPRLSADERAELQESITALERHYFADANGDTSIDLKATAEKWVRRMRGGAARESHAPAAGS